MNIKSKFAYRKAKMKKEARQGNKNNGFEITNELSGSCSG